MLHVGAGKVKHFFCESEVYFKEGLLSVQLLYLNEPFLLSR